MGHPSTICTLPPSPGKDLPTSYTAYFTASSLNICISVFLSSWLKCLWLYFTWMIKWLDLQTAALNQLISRRTTQRVLWNPMEINSNKIIIIKTIVGFMIKKTTKCNSKLLFIFSIKTYGLGTQKNHLNGKVLLSTQNKCKNWCQINFPQF